MAVWRSDFYGRSYSISQFNSSNFLSWRSLASLFSARARAVTVDALSDGINDRSLWTESQDDNTICSSLMLQTIASLDLRYWDDSG